MFVKIAKIGNNETIALACSELKKYFSMIDADNDYAIMSFDCYNENIKDALWVGICDKFEVPEVEDCSLDDAISIDVKACKGYISGTNERAVLIAVYRFLRELGCAFIRPGADGEVVPSFDLSEKSVKVFEKPSYRHRAVCIEGADSFSDICDFVEWLPKVGMNGFYNQFRIPYTFYLRWYSHKHNQNEYAPNEFTIDDAKAITDETVREIKKRGLLYHSVGHGWTCEPFGIDGLGWFESEKPADESVKKHLALLDGKRDFYKGVPLNTNLCYSSNDVKTIMSDAIVKYSEEHPEIDYMHVWLADGSNNQCECDECKKLRPSDYYIQLLNLIDEKLTQKGLDTKIVFLIYVDLLWGPLKEKLKNPDRFVLMFAPITRTYSYGMAENAEFEGELVDYNRNKNKMPANVAENIAHLRNWQKDFKGDSFDFDYHYMWDHFKDIGNFKTAKVLFDDMKNLDKIGLNGMVSCQCIRSFFPHGLGMNGMAEALWDKTKSFEDVVDNYFSSAYGKYAKEVANYFEKISELSHPVFVRAEYEHTINPDLVKDFEKCKKVVAEFDEFLKNNVDNSNATVSLSYRYLSYQTKFATLYLDWEIALAQGDVQKAETALDAVVDYAAKTEKILHRVFDYYVFRNTIIRKMHNKLIEKM